MAVNTREFILPTIQKFSSKHFPRIKKQEHHLSRQVYIKYALIHKKKAITFCEVSDGFEDDSF
ncbi:hypothetical protein [Guptibacillus hwajinpoensis]|uniref:hypothetical protein n=1 Tax=Guptibacillus hwajinpoensis TaxID=208199 RepID=UPI001CFE7E43|nr:hypothetical protein [Pseudalkalibacillus hwajinpoensis]WLR60639.1 hypothetical protein LC071_04590 [Pseudalkalibacillus hwajinpoensis]